MTSTPLPLWRPEQAAWVAPLLASITLLSACGGSGGSTGAGGSGATLTGVVAVGAPLANATVEAWCDGELAASTTTDAAGRFEAKLARLCLNPWLLQAIQGDGSRLNGSTFSDVPGTGVGQAPPVSPVVLGNITPLTDLLTQAALKDYGFDDLQALSRQLSVDEVSWQEMLDGMRDALALINDSRPPTIDPVTLERILQRPFRPEAGDPMDDLLEAFAAQRGTVTTRALLEQADSRGGDLASGQPWKTVFGDRTTLTLSGADCVSSGAPSGPATATLRMQDQDLAVTLDSSRFAAPVTFTVGPAARSDFQLIVNGDSPLVRLRASAGGNRLDLFTQTLAPMVTLSAAGATVTCTLPTPVRRADLVAFHPAARLRSVIPAAGASGSCPASAAGAAYSYAVSRLGDVRFDGASLAPGWLDAAHAYYSESLQYGMGGPGPSYQVQLAALPTGQGIQGYYFSTVPYGMNCTDYNP